MRQEHKMPNMDGTGPRGFGPLTGRLLGPCSTGNGISGGYGRGFGRSFGRGYGYRRFFLLNSESLTKTDEKKLLEEDLKEIESEKQEIEKRLKELK